MNSTVILIIHIVSGIILFYLGYSSIVKLPVPMIIGFIVCGLSLYLLGVSVHDYIEKETYNNDKDRRMHQIRSERLHRPSIFSIMQRRE